MGFPEICALGAIASLQQQLRGDDCPHADAGLRFDRSCLGHL